MHYKYNLCAITFECQVLPYVSNEPGGFLRVFDVGARASSCAAGLASFQKFPSFYYISTPTTFLFLSYITSMETLCFFERDAEASGGCLPEFLYR